MGHVSERLGGRRVRAVVAAVCALLASSCGGSRAATPITRPAGLPCGGSGPPPETYEHVIWVWMENHRADQVLGNKGAPYESTLAAQCGRATNYRQNGSPSLPNYIAATSGDTWKIDDDDPPVDHPLAADNLFRQVRATGRAARSYQESMPTTCALTSHDRDAVKHNPAAYYTGDDDRDACGRDDLPLGTLDTGPFHDALANDDLPAFSFVTPNLCNDTHDCRVATGDKWLARFLTPILSSRSYQAGRTAVFIVWDEEEPMPFIAVAPTIPSGTVLSARVDHYALLRTTEELLGIAEHLVHAADAPSMRPALNL